jgi:hypothetical protein
MTFRALALRDSRSGRSPDGVPPGVHSTVASVDGSQQPRPDAQSSKHNRVVWNSTRARRCSIAGAACKQATTDSDNVAGLNSEAQAQARSIQLTGWQRYNFFVVTTFKSLMMPKLVQSDRFVR